MTTHTPSACCTGNCQQGRACPDRPPLQQWQIPQLQKLALWLSTEAQAKARADNAKH